MGKRGPKPTPKAVLNARGSWRGKAQPGDLAPDLAAPECPGYLNADAKLVWDQMLAILAPLGVLASIDAGALARYCDAFVRWRKTAAFLDKNGDTYPLRGKDRADGSPGPIKCIMQFPQVSIYRSLASMLARLEAEFGLTPSSRSRITVPIASAPRDSGAPPAHEEFPPMKLAQ